MPVNVLAVGSNPNLAFYAWRLQETKQVELTVVNKVLNTQAPISWTSSSKLVAVSKPSYIPHHFYSSVSALSSHSTPKFDIVLLSSSSLQDFQTSCTDIVPYVSEETIVLVESSGYVNLEPFVQMSFPPKLKNIHIASIMNESDVRQTGQNSYHHTIRGTDSRIYFGTSVGTSSKSKSRDLSKSANFQRMYKLLQSIQESSQSSISLLKSLNPKEFTTYQWKLALPRITYYTLSIIFESEFPERLASQILCKPLISGTINEIFKIIKKMDCKLVKGYESEVNLLKNQAENFPVTKNNDDLMNSNSLLHAFSNGYDLEIDLLLLQPILLGDDNGIRTPYLENLYSMVCQYAKINETGKSMFFERKGTSAKRDLEDKTRTDELNRDLEHKLNQLSLLDNDINGKTLEIKNYESNLSKQQILKVELENDIVKNEIRLNELVAQTKEAERSLNNVQVTHEQKLRELNDLERKLREPPVPVPVLKSVSQDNFQNGQSSNNSQNNIAAVPNGVRKNRESVQPNDNLEDLADIAMYGASLNNEVQYQPNGKSSRETTPKDLREEFPAQAPQTPQAQKLPLGPQSYSQSQLPQNGYYKPNQVPPHQQFFDDQQNYPAAPQNFVNPAGPPIQNQNQRGYQQPPQQPQYGPQPNGYAPNGFQPSPLEQHPPHGLPANGLPAGQLPPNLRGSSSIISNVNRYQNPPQQQQLQQPPNGSQVGYPQGGRPRISSVPTSVHSSYYDGNGQSNGYGSSNPAYNPVSFNNAAPIDPLVEQRFRNNPKRNNRRSAYPQMNGNIDGLDFSGRGGMPFAAGQVQNKHRSMNYAPVSSPPMNQRKSMSNANTLVIPQYPQNQVAGSSSQNFLQPPAMNDNTLSSNSSTNSNDTPKTSNSNERDTESNVAYSIQVPDINDNAKPLGSIGPTAPLTPEKKKRGLFGRKKK